MYGSYEAISAYPREKNDSVVCFREWKMIISYE